MFLNTALSRYALGGIASRVSMKGSRTRTAKNGYPSRSSILPTLAAGLGFGLPPFAGQARYWAFHPAKAGQDGPCPTSPRQIYYLLPKLRDLDSDQDTRLQRAMSYH